MPASPQLTLHFSAEFSGNIWRLITHPDDPILFAEVRDTVSKIASFSAVAVNDGDWLWKDVTFEEKWWLSLAGASANVLLLTIYIDQQNPDKKMLLALDMRTRAQLWFRNNFALSHTSGKTLTGVDSMFGAKEVVLDLFSGNPVVKDTFLSTPQNFDVIRPFHYQEGSSYFESVSSFLKSKLDLSPRFSVDYCEHRSLIFISAFTGEKDLANYLIVLNSNGEILLQETLGKDLKGIATDTFFLYAGCLIFVKNKRVLVSYKLV